MNIIINESQEQLLMNTLLKEGITIIKTNNDEEEEPISELTDKILRVKEYLDKNYSRGSIDQIKDGKPSKLEVVVLKNADGKVLKSLTDKQLFDQVQLDFEHILPEKDRDSFLKDCITKWYYNKISDLGTFGL